MRERRKRKLIMYVLMVALLVTTVAYAVLQTSLNINGLVTKRAGKWNIYFDNPKVVSTTGDAEITLPDTFPTNTTSFDFNVTVVKPADSTTFTVDVVNDGTIDAVLDSIILSGIAEAEAQDVIFTITYSDGTSINKGDMLSKDTRKSLKLTVIYDEEATTLASEDVILNLGVTLIYLQTLEGTITGEPGTDDGGEPSYDEYDNLPIFVNSIEDCTDTSKKYVLPDGYLYEYLPQYTSGYTNQISISTDTDGSIYNSVGYKEDSYMSSSGSVSSKTGSIASGFIPYTPDQTLYYKGVDLSTNNSYTRITFYDSSKTLLGVCTQTGAATQTVHLNSNFNITEEGDYYKMTPTGVTTSYPGTAYIRVSVGTGLTGDEWIMTVDEEITEATLIGNAWQKTEQYVPSDWISEINTTITTINNLNTGSSKVQFLLTSDIHLEPTFSGTYANYNYVKNIGKVSAAVMQAVDIPFFMNVGDSVTQSSAYNVSIFQSNIEQVLGILSPIPQKNILMTVGNHDGATGQKVVNGETVHYRHQLSNEERKEIFFDWQYSTNSKKIFGPGGTYYYIDDESSKTRYIMLNSFWTEWEGDEDGFVTNVEHSFFYKPLLGQEQLTWFANTALNMPSGYSAVIGTHNLGELKDIGVLKGIISAYKNRTTYTGSYTGTYDWQSSSITVNYSNARGELIAIFQGHEHLDAISTSVYAIPCINITSAGAFLDVRDENAPTRTAGTATETAIDVVTIDKGNRKIYLTRLGVGEDRVVDY